MSGKDCNNVPVERRPTARKTFLEIADLGNDDVPELIEELDATNNQRMIRCLGFLLRASGDRRAVPALMRAIPQTLIARLRISDCDQRTTIGRCNLVPLD